MPNVFSRFIVAGLLAIAPLAAFAQEAQRVGLKNGAATLKGRIAGDASADYVFAAPAGAPIVVTLKSANRSAYFNLYAPGEAQSAVFIGSTSGARYEGAASVGGDYRVDVYLMRNAARRGARAAYALTVSVGGGAAQTASAGPQGAEAACLAAVTAQVNTPGAATIRVAPSRRETRVTVRVPQAQAPWLCVWRAGKVRRVLYTGSEGAL